MNYISVCKNTIASNNKKQWIEPDPCIRVAKTPSGKVTMRANHIGIVDRNGDIVGWLEATTDGMPIIKCGAKVALITLYDVVEMFKDEEV